ncbi:MAG TPA: flippase activity-associated protein Agl23, partial [Chloroflexota bacterium]|nr:flippase activity-associated protein Agl23 [Chloroflexota bacterium]
MAATVERPRGVPLTEEPRREAEPFDLARPARPPLTVEHWAWFGLVAIAFLMRIWDLGQRAMHHDESMHAFYGYTLFKGGGYHYDPMLHGPFQFHALALMDFLFGPSDAASRLTAVLCGTGMVIASWWLRPYLGRLGAFLAAALFTISPSFLYFSRFAREDIYVTFFTYLMVVGMFGWLATRKPRFIYLLFVATALAFATKESTFITLFIFGSFLILVLLWENRSLVPLPSRWERLSEGAWDLGVTQGLRAVGRSVWVTAIVWFAIIIVLLFTTFLTNRHGLQDAFTSSLTYWLGQQNVARGSQPGYYYALLLPAYEQIPVLFGIVGICAVVFRRWWLAAVAVVVVAGQALAIVHGGPLTLPLLALTALVLGLSATVLGLSQGRLFPTFLAYWSILAFIIYSWAGEKMPWLVLQLALPLLLMAALFLGELFSAPRWNEGRWAVAIVCAVLGLFAIHVDWPLVYERGDVPKDMLIYTQTSPQVKQAVAQIDQLSDQLTGGKDLKILIDSASTWPFAWYLRDYKNVAYQPTISSPPDQPVVITAVENDAQDKPQLQNYVGNRYKLRTWFPEDYKDLTLPKVFQSVIDPVMRKTLWNWLTLREPPSPMGSYDFNLWIRKDLAPGVASNFSFTPAPAAAGAQPVLGPDPYADKVTKLASLRQFGSQGSGDGQLLGARGVAVAPDGSIYVADQGNNRIQKFDPSGKFVLKWGSKGSGDGQFDLPSGVAVDKAGNVWVSDLWNHRVQEFDASGKFVLKFGSFANATAQAQPGKFFGPRYIAIGQDGSVYVTDTGNKRIQKFKPDGTFVAAWGAAGNGAGQLEEPMGLTFDVQGNLYVADTWNRRIQKLTADGQFQSLIPVASWPSAQTTTG